MPLTRIPRPRPVWIEPEPIPDDFDILSLHPHRLIASLLYRRGIRTPEAAHAFLSRDEPDALDPTLMPNMGDALARTARALENREHIGVFGDYDADGITSAALLDRVFRSILGDGHITTFVPERKDGYGVSERGVRLLAEAGATLMIAVDCGTNDLEAVALAQSLGMDVIILDHHSLSTPGPENAILVSAQLRDDGVYRELTGVGVAWLFTLGLLEMGYPVARLDGDDPARMLDLVALGTVADVGPLRGANRTLVNHGLAMLRQAHRPGVRAMLRHGQIEPSALTADRISFGLGPRLNAAGRVSSPRAALDLLLAEDDVTADQLAMQIERWNSDRKQRTDIILQDVSARILAMPDWKTRPFFALYGKYWEKGLVGPIAAKITEQMGVPAIVMHEEDGMLSGSGRSVPGVNLLRLIEPAADLLDRYGGHSGAVGVSLPLENYEPFVATVTRAVAEQQLALPQPPQLRLHAWLPERAQQLSVVRSLGVLEPFGQDNPFPIFGIQNARVRDVRTMGRGERKHLKITVGTRGREMEAILWGGAFREHELRGATEVDLAGTLDINQWNGIERLQLILKDFNRPR